MAICSKCGAQNPDGNFNCTNCGAPLAAPSFDAPVVNAPASQPCGALATLSMIFGIVSLCCGGTVFSILAIVFGAIAKGKGNTTGKPKAGITMGIISLVLWIVFFIIYYAFIFAAASGGYYY